MVNACCVKSCKNRKWNTKVKMHRFPADENLRRIWLEKLGDPKLKVKDSMVIYKNYRICDIHFRDEDRITAGRRGAGLKANSIPSVFLDVIKNRGNADNDTVTAISRSNSYSSSITMSSLGAGASFNKNLRAAPFTKRRTLSSLTLIIFKDLKKTVKRFHFFNNSNQERIGEAIKFARSPEFLAIRRHSKILDFFILEMSKMQKKTAGERFTYDDKLFALTLCKESSKIYKLLRVAFALPPKKSLMEIINKINFNVGIMPKVMHALKRSVREMDFFEKRCTLMFDEISLQPSLVYDKKWDRIIGFEEINKCRKFKLADRALVFMVRGIESNWKQPVSFYFTQGTMNSERLKVIIQNTILALQKIGFVVLATVCKQSAANANALRKLKLQSAKKRGKFLEVFEVGGQEIFGIYDPPHLLKCMRDEFIRNNVIFTTEGVEKQATWSDIIKFYEMDQGNSDYKLCYKLTDSHIYPEKVEDKFEHAAQVFSHSLAAFMMFISKHGRGLLPKSAEETAMFLSFMNQVFDSVNGSTYHNDDGNVLNCAIKAKSAHVKFWIEAIKTFKSIKFVTPQGYTVPTVVKNWIITFRGLFFIWKKLHSDMFEHVLPRNINLDFLERFFQHVRDQEVRNVSPSCSSFVSSYKSFIYNNFASCYYPEDIDKKDGYILNDLITLLAKRDETADVNVEGEIIEFINVGNKHLLDFYAHVAGYVSRNVRRKIGNCPVCMNELLATSSIHENLLLEEWQYKKKSLMTPKTRFRRMFNDMMHLFLEGIKKCILKNNLCNLLTATFKKSLHNPFSCSTHNTFEIYMNYFITFFMHAYLKNINSILKGRVACNVKNDPLTKLAWHRHFSAKAQQRKRRVSLYLLSNK